MKKIIKDNSFTIINNIKKEEKKLLDKKNNKNKEKKNNSNFKNNKEEVKALYNRDKIDIDYFLRKIYKNIYRSKKNISLKNKADFII